MRAVSTLALIGTALWLSAPSAHALGFGGVSNATQLGQPLNFSATVHVDADESLARECVFAEVTSGDNKLQPGQVRVWLDGGTDSPERTVHVTTIGLIDEPVVAVNVTLGCTSKVTRKFVAFVDPPLIGASPSGGAEAVPNQPQDSQVAPLMSIVQPQGARVAAVASAASAPAVPSGSRPATVRRRPKASPATSASATPAPTAEAGAPVAPHVRRPATRPAATAAAAPRRLPPAAPVASGPRLKLDAQPLVTAVAGTPAAAASAASAGSGVPAQLALAPASAASVAPDAAAEQLALQQRQIQTLEDGLTKLRADSLATQRSLDTLQVRLKEAESERYANPLVYGLAWLSALLALALAALWWRQSRSRLSSQWWAAPPGPDTVAGAQRGTANPTTESAPLPLGAVPTAADAFAVMNPTLSDDPLPPLPVAPAPRAAAPVGPAPVVPEPTRELSVEELIDLEQQAEFFIVLGQDEAAIELLMSHVRSNGGISPMPYLKLLEIYRRRGEHEAYQRIRERFNRRFNAYAPDWDADLQQGRSLADYPDTIARLSAIWANPSRVMETLDASLFRRNLADETFDLPAYRELLFLYSIARDLAEHDGARGPRENVDLLLPLDHEDDEPISHLRATEPGEFQSSDLMTMPLDLDVSFTPAATQTDVETMPSALRRTSTHRLQDESAFIDLDMDLTARPGPTEPTGKP